MILIAGGTGHLGTKLVPLLAARGLQVRVLTRDPERARRTMGQGVEAARGDVRDPASLKSALAGVDAVVSAITGFGPGGEGPRPIDHQGNRNLIHAAEAAGAGRYVLMSMHGAAPDHPMELLRAKYLAEQELRASTLEWTIIRPTVFMELWAGIVGGPILTTGRATIFGRGDNPVNFISAGDVARFVDLALSDPALRDHELDIGGPENVTLTQLAIAVANVVGRRAALRHVPLPAMRLASVLMRPIKPDVAGLIHAGVQMDTSDMTLDVSDLRRRFPTIPLSALEEVVRREYGSSPPL